MDLISTNLLPSKLRYNKARPMVEKDYCTMGGFISKLIEQESKKRKGRMAKPTESLNFKNILTML